MTTQDEARAALIPEEVRRLRAAITTGEWARFQIALGTGDVLDDTMPVGEASIECITGLRAEDGVGRIVVTIASTVLSNADAEFIAAGPAIADAYLALLDENERLQVIQRAIADCRDDPASAIVRAEVAAGAFIIEAHLKQVRAEAERDALQARIDAALGMLNYFRAWDVTPEQIDNLRRILSGPQPTVSEEDHG